VVVRGILRYAVHTYGLVYNDGNGGIGVDGVVSKNVLFLLGGGHALNNKGIGTAGGILGHGPFLPTPGNTTGNTGMRWYGRGIPSGYDDPIGSGCP
jgi:hypothetical protein